MADIPNEFHFVFGLKPQVEPFHLVYYLCLASCLEVNRPDRIHFHYHFEPYGPWWERIRPQLELHRVEPVRFIARSEAYWQHAEGTYIRRANLDYAHQADFLRLEILKRHGGVYADIDTLFVRPLGADLFSYDCVIGSEGESRRRDTGEVYESLCNAFILARPGARFVSCWLESMYELFDGTWDRHSCYGASVVRQRMPDAVHVVPRAFFYRYVSTPEDLAILLEGAERDLGDAYSIHLWNHLWWEPSRTDFSNVSKETLTERYVRDVDTTFTLLARRFLD